MTSPDPLSLREMIQNSEEFEEIFLEDFTFLCFKEEKKELADTLLKASRMADASK